MNPHEQVSGSDSQVLLEHSVKPSALMVGSVTSRRVWKHAFGEMLIETCDDGSVWIDGKPVTETLPLALPSQTASVGSDGASAIAEPCR